MDINFINLAAAGAGIGAIMGLTGAGGGILSVPLLVMGIGLPLQQASPIALMAISAAALLAALIGLYRKNLRYRAAALMACAGLLGSPVGLLLAARLPTAPLQALFGGVLMWVAIRGLRKIRRSGNRLQTDQDAQADDDAQALARNAPPCRLNPTVGRLVWTNPCARALAASGLLAGFMAGLLGVGGGFVLIPALQRYTDLDASSIVATSLGVLALVTGGSALMAAAGGSVVWGWAMPFVAGAITGLAAGKWLEPRLQARAVAGAFSLLALATGVLMTAKAFA